MKAIWAGLLALAAMGGAATAQPAWEGVALSPAQKDACQTLARALVRPVLPAYRAEATRALGAAPAVRLTEAQAAAWIDVPLSKDGPLADRLLTDAVAVMDVRREESIGEHAPKWTAKEQAMYERTLQARAAPHAGLQPFLVRAVGGAERGAFDAADCGGALAIRYGVQGAMAPETTHAPVIVFAAQAPSGVQAWREVVGP
jgi:hypothetical protein